MKVNALRIKVAHINPAGTSLESLSEKGAFLGVSLNNPTMASSTLQLLEWSSFNFQPLQILIGDYIERHNLILETGGNLTTASELAMSKAEPIKASIERAILQNPKRDIKIITSRDIVLGERFKEVFPVLEAHFKTNSVFRAIILNDINNYIDRTEKHRRPGISREMVAHHSACYILEELAIFSILIEQGVFVQLYPGRHLNILIELANKRVRSPVFGLNDLICIDLAVSP